MLNVGRWQIGVSGALLLVLVGSTPVTAAGIRTATTPANDRPPTAAVEALHPVPPVETPVPTAPAVIPPQPESPAVAKVMSPAPANSTAGPAPLSGCAAARAYLAAHANPAYAVVCPAYSGPGNAAVTCLNTPGYCPVHPDGTANRLIIITDVTCPVAWHNEAVNSFLLERPGGYSANDVDPFGPC